MLNRLYNIFKEELRFIKDSLVELKNHAGTDLKVNGVWYCFIFAILFIFLREFIVDMIVYNDFTASCFPYLYSNTITPKVNQYSAIVSDQRFMYYLWIWFCYIVKLPLSFIVFIAIFFLYLNSILLLYLIELLGKIKLSLFIKLSFIILCFLMLISFQSGAYLKVSGYVSIFNICMFIFLLFIYSLLLSFYNNKVNYVSGFIIVVTGACIVGSYSTGIFNIYYLLLFAFLYESFYINKSHNIKEFLKRTIKYLILLIAIFCALKLINFVFMIVDNLHKPDKTWRDIKLPFLQILKNSALGLPISNKYLIALFSICIFISLKITKNYLYRATLVLILFLSLYIIFATDLLLKQDGTSVRFYLLYIYIPYLVLACLILYRNSKIYLYLGILVTILNLYYFNSFVQIVEYVQKTNKNTTYMIENVNSEYKSLCYSMDCPLLLLADTTLLKNQNNFYLPTWWVWHIDTNVTVKGMIGQPHHYRNMADMKDKKITAIWEEKMKLGIRYPMSGSIIKAIDDSGKTVVIVFM